MPDAFPCLFRFPATLLLYLSRRSIDMLARRRNPPDAPNISTFRCEKAIVSARMRDIARSHILFTPAIPARCTVTFVLLGSHASWLARDWSRDACALENDYGRWAKFLFIDGSSFALATKSTP